MRMPGTHGQIGAAVERNEVPPRGVGAARMAEPKRARRFLPVRDERLQEPALLGSRMGPASAKGYFAT